MKTKTCRQNSTRLFIPKTAKILILLSVFAIVTGIPAEQSSSNGNGVRATNVLPGFEAFDSLQGNNSSDPELDTTEEQFHSAEGGPVTTNNELPNDPRMEPTVQSISISVHNNHPLRTGTGQPNATTRSTATSPAFADLDENQEYFDYVDYSSEVTAEPEKDPSSCPSGMSEFLNAGHDPCQEAQNGTLFFVQKINGTWQVQDVTAEMFAMMLTMTTRNNSSQNHTTGLNEHHKDHAKLVESTESWWDFRKIRAPKFLRRYWRDAKQGLKEFFQKTGVCE